MSRIDINRVLTLATLIVIIVVAAMSNYRLEIGTSGLKFERNDGNPVHIDGATGSSE